MLGLSPWSMSTSTPGIQTIRSVTRSPRRRLGYMGHIPISWTTASSATSSCRTCKARRASRRSVGQLPRCGWAATRDRPKIAVGGRYLTPRRRRSQCSQRRAGSCDLCADDARRRLGSDCCASRRPSLTRQRQRTNETWRQAIDRERSPQLEKRHWSVFQKEVEANGRIQKGAKASIGACRSGGTIRLAATRWSTSRGNRVSLNGQKRL